MYRPVRENAYPRVLLIRYKVEGRDDIRRAYDDIAETYAAERTENGAEMNILAEFLSPLPEEAHILDAGCGQGTPVLRRSNVTATACGLDFSRGQLRLATENAPDVPLVQADIAKLPIADGVFDAITAYHTLIHVPTEDQQTVIAEFARVLRPGGRLLVSAGAAKWTGTNSDWLDTGVEMQWDIAGVEATRTQLQKAGVTIFDEWEVDEDEHWVFLAAQLDSQAARHTS